FISWGAAGWHICFDVLERLLAGEPIGRIVGADAMKFGGWQRLNAEYAKQFGVEDEQGVGAKRLKLRVGSITSGASGGIRLDRPARLLRGRFSGVWLVGDATEGRGLFVHGVGAYRGGVPHDLGPIVVALGEGGERLHALRLLDRRVGVGWHVLRHLNE